MIDYDVTELLFHLFEHDDKGNVIGGSVVEERYKE